MKKLVTVSLSVLCILCLLLTGCDRFQRPVDKTATPSAKSIPTDTPEGIVTPGTTKTAEPSVNPSGLPSVDPSGSASPDTTDESTLAPETTGPTISGQTPTPTPSPTPNYSLRPAQTASIVPAPLLTVGYTTRCYAVPKNYNMPYYIEVDLNNQCINVFIKDPDTGLYDILLNRFVCSAGTTSQPSLKGTFYIQTDEQQKARTGQKVKYPEYYFEKYGSTAYYITRYRDAYMFHSFTFKKSGKYQKPKTDYYNMGSPGSAGCLRMLMGHAKWIYNNIDPGTCVVVHTAIPKNSTLISTLKAYVPPLGYDITPDYVPKDYSKGLVRCDNVREEFCDSLVTPTPTVEPTPTLIPTEGPSVSPTVTPAVTPTITPETSPTATPDVTPTATPALTPTATPALTPTPTPESTSAPQATATPTPSPTETPQPD